MSNTSRNRLAKVEEAFGAWASERGVAMLRVTLGVVFVWFGVLKLCPGLCDVETLAARTMQLLTLGLIPARICLRILAMAECAIGAGLIAGRWMRVVTFCLMLHLSGTFLPMMLLPGETWKHFPYAPTLVGQSILKNIVLIAAAIVVGASAFAKAGVPVIVPMRRREGARENLFVELNGAETQVVAMRGREWRRF
jgi:uncharacterized membrane protein YkgB